MPLRLLPLAILALAACVPAAGRPTQSTPASITYATGPCYGTCPVYSVTVRADGGGTFTGERFTAVTGARDFTLAPGRFAAFADLLAAHRPEGSEAIAQGHPRCPIAPTDHSTVSVTWNDAEGPDSLSYYFGCRGPGLGALAEALSEAPALLPIREFIGSPDPSRVPTGS